MRFVSDNRIIDHGVNKRHMEVIAAGLPRCATSSLQEALESTTLGFFPSMHMAHVVPHPKTADLVCKAMAENNREKRHELLYELFDGCAATCDFPGVAFTDDLMDMYPNAKIILNQRDNAEVWATSMLDSIVSFNTWYHKAATCLFPRDRNHQKMIEDCFIMWRAKFSLGRYPDRASMILLYERYNDWVRAEAAKRGREILEYKPKDGMAPLCKFLGAKEICNEKLPATNDKAQMQMLKNFLLIRGLLSWAGIFASFWFGFRYLTKYAPVVMRWL